MSVHIHWLVTTPRLPAGLLTLRAWDVLRAGDPVYAAPNSPQSHALRANGIEVTDLPSAEAVGTLLRTGGVWVTSAAPDETVSLALSQRLAADPSTATLEVTFGSWDPPGARLLDAVAVIDRLRSPGGCPWDAAQTHASLAPFLLEEAYETVDAIDSGDSRNLREELGDLLMQPLFHARFASEDPVGGFDIDAVAADAVEKLVRRHPHVFAGARAETADSMPDTWEELKRAEKPEREYAVDGVVTGQPALSLATKYLSRTARAKLDVPLPAAPDDPAADESALGAALLRLVAAAQRAGLDPELALRAAALSFAEHAKATEDTRKSG